MGSDWTFSHCSDYCMHANGKATKRASTQMAHSHHIHDLTDNLWCFGLAVRMERLILPIALVVILPVLVVLDASPVDSSIPDNEVAAS